MARKDQSILDDWLALSVVGGCSRRGRCCLACSSDTSPHPPLPTNPHLKSFAKLASGLAWIAFIFLLPAGHTFSNSVRKRRLLEPGRATLSQSALCRGSSWRNLLPRLNRDGYVVENYARGPDGGVDLRLWKNQNLYLVQCKRWRTKKVDVQSGPRDVRPYDCRRSLWRHFIITSGMFTQRSRNFASDKPVDLIDGRTFADMVFRGKAE